MVPSRKTPQFTTIVFFVLVTILAYLQPVKCLFRFGLVSTDPNDIKFYIYTNTSNIDVHNEIVYGNDKSILACGYDPKKPLILLIHSVLANYKTLTDVQLIKNAYLETAAPANIIMVNYAKLTESRLPPILSTFSYLHAIAGHLNTQVIGNRISEFIQFLMRAYVIQGPGHVHMIGFGTGAHIAGIAGRLLQEKTGSLVGRISGLDPSLHVPMRKYRLTQSNANFVDVSYTSLAKFGNWANTLGFRTGHVQFYINGGDVQPHCQNFSPFIDPFCSHASAVYYFAKSIKYRDVKSCPCGRLECRGNIFHRLMRFRNIKAQECIGYITYGQSVSSWARGNYQVVMS